MSRYAIWQSKDAAALAAILNNPKVLQNLRDGIPYPYTEADAAEYIRAMRAADPKSTFAFAVCADDTVVGNIGAFRGENIHFRTAELGYYLGENYWGKGIMTAAVRLLCAKLFRETDLCCIYAEPFEENDASRRVLEKAGFRQEGILRHNAVKDGIMRNMALYALLRTPAGE